jgi:hypothetical protein
MTDFIQKLAQRFLRGIKLSNGTMYKYTLKNTERVTKNGRFRETGNKGYTRRRQTKQKYATQYVLGTTIRKQTQIT